MKDWFDPSVYGLDGSSPVLLGGKPKSGADAVQDYLGQLRCPEGTPVRIQEFSLCFVSPEGAAKFAAARLIGQVTGETPYAILENLTRITSSVRGVFGVRCECGKHTESVYACLDIMDSQGERPIARTGWHLAPPDQLVHVPIEPEVIESCATLRSDKTPLAGGWTRRAWWRFW